MNILRNIYLIATDDFTVIGIGETKFSFEKRHKDGDWAKFHNFAKAKGLKVILAVSYTHLTLPTNREV